MSHNLVLEAIMDGQACFSRRTSEVINKDKSLIHLQFSY